MPTKLKKMRKKAAKKASRVNESGNYTKPGLRKRILKGSKPEVRAEMQDSGLPAKLRCSPSSTKLPVEATRTDGEDEDPEVPG